jgi:hypothetical protein
METPRPPLTPAHVERELGFAATALDRMDYTAAFEHLTTARAYLDRVPTNGASEYAFVAFASADESLSEAREAIEHGRRGGHRALSVALQSLRSATAQFEGLSGHPGS